jgi:large subunit ribosomal protein L6
MSKIGRQPISLNGVSVEISGQEIKFKGPKNSGVHILPEGLGIELIDNQKLLITCQDRTPHNKRLWGLHRALLSNSIKGAVQDFEEQLEINGLGFKAVIAGNKIEFTLGYSHKIPFQLPKEVSVVTDKTGQKLVVKSFDKEMLGKVCSQIRALRPPEPYKGTGIKYQDEQIIRKAGKARAA